MNKILRILVCFILISALLVNISPIRANAISTGVAVSAGIVAGAIIYGLGVSIGDHPDEFNSLVAEAITAMQTAGVVVTNGLMDVVSLGSGLFGVKSDTIQSLFDWLHADSGALYVPETPNVTFGTSLSGTYESASLACSSYDNFCVVSVGYTYYKSDGGYYPYRRSADVWAFSSEPASVTVRHTNGNSASYNVNIAGNSCFRANLYSNSGSAGKYYWKDPVVTGDIGFVFLGDFPDQASAEAALNSFDPFALSSSSPVTDLDLTLNFVANPGLSLAEGYPAWHSNSVTIPNAETGDGDIYYPIALGNSMEETQSFTQEQVWAGEGTYVDTETGTGTGSGSVTVPDTVTLKDILTGVISIPQAISIAAYNVVTAVQAIPAAIADIFTPKADLGHFSISLSDYFPFCIPFDIYDFLTCLNADPVAPVIEWVIFERDGTGHPITIDLSPFDSVAQILRTLQLLLFCVGLATKTRDLIKG